MIADCDANVVFVADTLEPRFPEVYRGLKSILGEHGIPMGTIPGTRDIWCRDYLPIQVAEDQFVQFRYAPDYLTGKYRHLRKDGEIGPTLPWAQNCVRSEIVLDGGNVVRWRDEIILTEKIFAENPRIAGVDLLRRLKDLLRAETLTVIPTEPEDPIGHADGMVRWLDERTIVVNDYRAVSERYRRQLLRRLEGLQVDLVEISYLPQDDVRDGIPSAVGNWANFLHVGHLIIVPMFGEEQDRSVLGILRDRCPNLAVEGLECRALAEEGGVINCITWQVARSSGRADG
jgi:agmatine/peptidylarginine deiminase